MELVGNHDKLIKMKLNILLYELSKIDNYDISKIKAGHLYLINFVMTVLAIILMSLLIYLAKYTLAYWWLPFSVIIFAKLILMSILRKTMCKIDLICDKRTVEITKSVNNFNDRNLSHAEIYVTVGENAAWLEIYNDIKVSVVKVGCTESKCEFDKDFKAKDRLTLSVNLTDHHDNDDPIALTNDTF